MSTSKSQNHLSSYLTVSKSSNGRKIARMAPILTIFGPKSSQQCDLFVEKFSNERANEQTNDLCKNFSKFFRTFFDFVFDFLKIFRALRSFEIFSKNRSRRDDSFGPKIVKIRAILAIFRPFEDFPMNSTGPRSKN